MIEGPVSPVDELTGMPLPLLVVGSASVRHDWHHHFHPYASPDLKKQHGKALRYSRVQRVPKWLHTRYHQEFDGPPLPSDKSGKFLLVMLACAGYIPRQALDVSGPKPQVVGLKKQAYNPYRRSRQIGFEVRSSSEAGDMTTHGRSKAEIGKFLCNFAISQNLSHIQPDIDRFLESSNPKKVRRLGRQIMQEAIAVAVEPTEEVYLKAWRSELILPGAPNSATEFVTSIVQPYLTQYVPELRTRLAA